MARVPAATLVAAAEPESSAVVGARIASCRTRALARNGGRLNGRLRGRELRRRCPLDASGRGRLIELGEAEAASGRGTERLLRVARTIADLAGAPDVRADHLDEAAWFGGGGAPRLDALAS
jgi:magnesium chelatase family protein